MKENRGQELGTTWPRKAPGKKIGGFLMTVAILLFIYPTEAQQTAKIHRMGWLSLRTGSSTPDFNRHDRFLQGLREHGWVEGQNLIIERRYAKGKEESLPRLAAELVNLRVEVIVAAGSAAIRPATQATRTIPIVMTVSGDPVGRGYAASLAQPAGNITGLSNVSPDLAGKRLELLKEAVPKLPCVAVLGRQPLLDWKEISIAAAAMGIKLKALKVQRAEEFAGAFEVARMECAAGLIVLPSPLTNRHGEQIVALTAKRRLPAMYPLRQYVEVGGLMAYGPNLPEMYHRAAYYVDKILKGAKPADLPVEQPTKFELVINLRTAKTLGLKIPAHLLMEAGKVIE
jgi:putative tryptophan/tyrosine transport system substrate-binding protein